VETNLTVRDHLFISYAWEDGALAEWLALKLTAAGYRIWCDRFKMLGGERWPEDIDRAIKTETFRMIHLLSVHSLHKENPSKERQLALTLSKERTEEFLIPLNVDGSRAADLPWQVSDINYIPFQDWGTGLQQLLKKLESCTAPRPLLDSGRQIAVETFLPLEAVLECPEVLQSNCLPFQHVPTIIDRFILSRPLTQSEEQDLSDRWAFYRVDDQKLLAFAPPSISLPSNLTMKRDGGGSWPDLEQIDSITSRNVVVSLLKKSLTVKCIERGLKIRREDGLLYFPDGLLEKNRIKYLGYRNRRTRVDVIGERKSGGGKIRYHLAIAFWIRRDVLEGFAAMIKIRLHLVDTMGKPLEARLALKKRKQIAKSWWNHQWLSRQMALRAFLANGGESIVIGDVPERQVILSAFPIQSEVPISINEQFLRPLSIELRKLLPTELDAISDDELIAEDS
jgi:TIR domain-containing protein